MSDTARLLLSALISGVVTFLTAFVALAVELPPEATVNDIGGLALIVAAVGAVLQFLKDIRTFLARPPAVAVNIPLITPKRR